LSRSPPAWIWERICSRSALGLAPPLLAPPPRQTTSALEIDPEAAARLSEELAVTNVTVQVGDATHRPFPDQSFDSFGCFTMLHHVATAHAQFQILCAIHRLLRPCGVLVGADSLASQELHEFHEGDTYNPMDPARLLVFL